MKITREEITSTIKHIEADLLNMSDLEQPSICRCYLELNRLALAGFDAQWREVATDPPPKVDGTEIEIFSYKFLYRATWHSHSNEWVDYNIKPIHLGTHWRYAIGLKWKGKNDV